jgi:ATP-dependent RNA helicase DDX5/DBP2
MATVERNHYHEHESVKGRSEEDISTFRAEKKIHIEGKATPRPITAFEEASFPGIVS